MVAAHAWDAAPVVVALALLAAAVAAAHAWSLAACHEVLATGTLQESMYSDI
jgi:hypothetical protein